MKIKSIEFPVNNRDRLVKLRLPENAKIKGLVVNSYYEDVDLVYIEDETTGVETNRWFHIYEDGEDIHECESQYIGSVSLGRLYHVFFTFIN